MPTKGSNIVKRTLDLKKPPRLSTEQKARLVDVAAMPDEQIGYRDAPDLPDAAWMKVGYIVTDCQNPRMIRIILIM